MLGLRDEEQIQGLWLNSSRALQRGLGQFCWCERHVGGGEVLALDGESNGEDVKMEANPGGTLVWAASFSLLVAVVVIAVLLVKREKSYKYLGLSPRHWLALKMDQKQYSRGHAFHASYWDGQKVHLSFSVMASGKTQTNFLANPIDSLLILISLWPWAHAEVLCSHERLKQSSMTGRELSRKREE